jgi:hypothetical protein
MMAQKIKKRDASQKPENRKPIPLPVWRYDFIE